MNNVSFHNSWRIYSTFCLISCFVHVCNFPIVLEIVAMHFVQNYLDYFKVHNTELIDINIRIIQKLQIQQMPKIQFRTKHCVHVQGRKYFNVFSFWTLYYVQRHPTVSLLSHSNRGKVISRNNSILFLLSCVIWHSNPFTTVAAKLKNYSSPLQ
jgi:hypothetical protein